MFNSLSTISKIMLGVTGVFVTATTLSAVKDLKLPAEEEDIDLDELDEESISM